MNRPVAVIVSCEHGGNRVPATFRRWFPGSEALLASHRGWDPGALAVARTLAAALDAQLVASTVSRLVVELNRSPSHPKLFSAAMHEAPASVRERAMAEHYEPHRTAIERLIAQAIAKRQRVLHVASHSFTPALDGRVRRADVGLLHDPSRRFETEVCRLWQQRLVAAWPSLTVRRNYPYRGTSDGLTTWLRKRYADRDYAGLELEVNQKHVGTRDWIALRRELARTLQDVVETLDGTRFSSGRPAYRARRADTRATA